MKENNWDKHWDIELIVRTSIFVHSTFVHLCYDEFSVSGKELREERSWDYLEGMWDPSVPAYSGLDKYCMAALIPFRVI